ncbi:substrate-binding domain-containing protein [uncultured Desulfuromonas sp.]|uniref:substrate-binding domain-containing protein n=1 Tax=uncultured Desulfuromonas sp. TaxID=181013 RepID=UPI002AAB0288|nr:substrate-binding domain-containing protein [uncultured Desulfuromonas sp.]
MTFLPQNKYVMDALELPTTVAPKHPLPMALLSYAHHVELVQAFLALVRSERGQTIFRDYGFADGS